MVVFVLCIRLRLNRPSCGFECVSLSFFFGWGDDLLESAPKSCSPVYAPLRSWWWWHQGHCHLSSLMPLQICKMQKLTKKTNDVHCSQLKSSQLNPIFIPVNRVSAKQGPLLHLIAQCIFWNGHSPFVMARTGCMVPTCGCYSGTCNTDSVVKAV